MQIEHTFVCGFAVLSIAMSWPVAAVAQTTYQDPKGRFEVEVPDGWNAAPDTQVDMTIIRRGAAEVDVSVIRQGKRTPMTAQQFVDSTVTEFKQQCPTLAERQRGNVTLAGHKAIYALPTC
ncbi:MAG: hypothetical protein JSS21_02265, partial [Proteobacteria bacterium]|nr:hypothetical protein [Pseudomonadota bacterium]